MMGAMTPHAPTPSTPALRVRPDLLVCEGCDAVFQRPSLGRGEQARCTRCAEPLARGYWLSIEAQLALSLTALIVFVVALASPIVSLELRGVHTEVSLLGAVQATWAGGEHVVALLAAATAGVFPLSLILLHLLVLVPLVLGRRVPDLVNALRVLRWATRWSMVEVFMLGTLIAVVRSAGLVTLVPGVGVFSFGVLTLLLIANQQAGLQRLWERASAPRA